MYPFLLCNVDVMISTLQRRLQDALLSLVGPSSSFGIGSHLGRDRDDQRFWVYTKFMRNLYFQRSEWEHSRISDEYMLFCSNECVYAFHSVYVDDNN